LSHEKRPHLIGAALFGSDGLDSVRAP